MTTEVTKEEWVVWKKDKVTKHLVASLLLKRNILLEGIAEGHTDGDSRLVDIGKCQALKDSVMFIVDDFDIIEPHEETDGT